VKHVLNLNQLVQLFQLIITRHQMDFFAFKTVCTVGTAFIEHPAIHEPLMKSTTIMILK